MPYARQTMVANGSSRQSPMDSAKDPVCISNREEVAIFVSVHLFLLADLHDSLLSPPQYCRYILPARHPPVYRRTTIAALPSARADQIAQMFPICPAVNSHSCKAF